MQVHRLLIAESDEAFLLAARQAFSADFEVLTCQDGQTALELLSTFRPQVLIINLFLPFKDGLTVLQQAATLPPVTIATTSMILPYAEKACLDLKIGYLMVSPCLNALRVRTIHMVNQWESSKSPEDGFSSAHPEFPDPPHRLPPALRCHPLVFPGSGCLSGYGFVCPNRRNT